jgi:hypothetical protein
MFLKAKGEGDVYLQKSVGNVQGGTRRMFLFIHHTKLEVQNGYFEYNSGDISNLTYMKIIEGEVDDSHVKVSAIEACRSFNFQPQEKTPNQKISNQSFLPFEHPPKKSQTFLTNV